MIPSLFLAVIHQDSRFRFHPRLRWTPNAGRCRRGRPKETWRRSFVREMKENGLTWAQVEHLARNRGGWRSFVLALPVSMCHRARRGLTNCAGDQLLICLLLQRHHSGLYSFNLLQREILKIQLYRLPEPNVKL